jgi:hypothetical protein
MQMGFNCELYFREVEIEGNIDQTTNAAVMAIKTYGVETDVNEIYPFRGEMVLYQDIRETIVDLPQNNGSFLLIKRKTFNKLTEIMW